MENDFKLSTGELPTNQNIYIVISKATGEEVIINGGVTFKAIDKNGKVHNIGCSLSASYFFKLITFSLDDEHQKSSFPNFFLPSWGIGSEFSSLEIKKYEERSWEEFMKHEK